MAFLAKKKINQFAFDNFDNRDSVFSKKSTDEQSCFCYLIMF